MICSCGHSATHYSVRLTAAGPRTCCRSCRSPRLHQSVANPFSSLRLDHATDEQGQPVEVSSLGQLREAEKRYHFKSLVANECSADFDKPPQHRPKDLLEQTTEQRGWLYPEVAEGLIREMRETGEL